MKRLLVLAVLFFSVSLFFLQSSSYTIAELENEGSISFVSEEMALIAVQYDEVPKFWITNNTDKTVYIDHLEILGAFEYGIDYLDSAILPGDRSEFTITGNAESVIGNTLQISAHWDDGEVEISSVLPFFIIEKAQGIIPILPANPPEMKEENIEENHDTKEDSEAAEKSIEVKEQQPDIKADNNPSGSITDMEMTSPEEASNTSEED